jgi:hypothetical protein
VDSGEWRVSHADFYQNRQFPRATLSTINFPLSTINLLGDISPKGRSALADSDPVFGWKSETNRLATSISCRTQGYCRLAPTDVSAKHRLPYSPLSTFHLVGDLSPKGCLPFDIFPENKKKLKKF